GRRGGRDPGALPDRHHRHRLGALRVVVGARPPPHRTGGAGAMSTVPATEAQRVLDFPGARSLGAILAAFRRGSSDPTSHTDGRWGGRWWLAWLTPHGPVT